MAVLFLGGPLVIVLMAILLWLFPDGRLPVLLATSALPVRTPVGVAVATLAAAALFNPLRRRVQRAVDRRFNRTRYDAEAVVAAFTSRLRQTVDFDAVQADLLATVHHAFQPAHVSLWSGRLASNSTPTSSLSLSAPKNPV